MTREQFEETINHLDMSSSEEERYELMMMGAGTDGAMAHARDEHFRHSENVNADRETLLGEFDRLNAEIAKLGRRK